MIRQLPVSTTVHMAGHRIPRSCLSPRQKAGLGIGLGCALTATKEMIRFNKCLVFNDGTMSVGAWPCLTFQLRRTLHSSRPDRSPTPSTSCMLGLAFSTNLSYQIVLTRAHKRDQLCRTTVIQLLASGGGDDISGNDPHPATYESRRQRQGNTMHITFELLVLCFMPTL